MIKAIGNNLHSNLQYSPMFASANNNILNAAQKQTKESFLNIPKEDWFTYSMLGLGYSALSGFANYQHGKEKGVKHLKAHTALYAILGFLFPLVLLPLGYAIDKKLHPEKND